MKQNTPFTQRRHAHILNRSLSIVLSIALSLSACHPDYLDDIDGDNDSGIALTHFQTEILTSTDGITTIPTAARTRSDGTDDKGYTGLVKTRFISDDVIHIVLTDADNSNAIAYSTATLQQQDGSATSTARWIISPAMSTPQNGNFELLAFYNGQTAPYIASSSQSAPEAALKAYIQAERGSLFTTAPDTPPYVDALTALYSSQSGNQTLANDPLKPSPGALNLASDGTLTASFQHRNAIINISGITNQLSARQYHPGNHLFGRRLESHPAPHPHCRCNRSRQRRVPMASHLPPQSQRKLSEQFLPPLTHRHPGRHRQS